MAKTQSLDSEDLLPSTVRTQTATRQRGVTPPPVVAEELVPLQFKMPASFVKAFKRAALDNDQKLNQFLISCFNVFMKEGKQHARLKAQPSDVSPKPDYSNH